MLKFGTNNIGKLYLGSNEIGKAYLGSNLVYEAGGAPTPPAPSVSFTMTSADLFAGTSCGGFINASTGRWGRSTTYYGVIIDLQGYEGGQIKFTRAANSTIIRYAYLTDGTFTHYSFPSFSAEAGYTGQISNDTDTAITETIPSDAHYMYIYVYSSGTNVAPTIVISGRFESLDVNLPASLFATNTTIGADGKVYTGSSAPSIVCSGYLSVADYAFCQGLQFKVNNYPSGVDQLSINVAEYTTNQTFIRRDTYTDAPYTQQLRPECAYVRIMVVCKNGGADLSGDVVRFDNDDIQTVAIDTE